MTRELLGPGDFSPPDERAFRCECGVEEDFDVEFCSADRCPQCCEAAECHVECSVCHKRTDEFEIDEGADPICVDCAVAATERRERLAERDEALLEDKGDEMRAARR